MPQLFDIDAEVEAFQPVRIKFRGKEYTLGETAMQVLLAMELLEGEVGAKEIVGNMPAILRTMCPDIVEALNAAPLVQAEEVALLKPVGAVLRGFTVLTKSNDGEAEDEA